MFNRNKLSHLAEDLYQRSKAAKISTVAAQSAYYLILSTFPLLILIVKLLQSAPFFQDQSFIILLQFFPEAVQDVLIPRIQELSNGTAIAPVAAFSVVYVASSGLMPITKGLNQAAGCPSERRGFVANRLISFLLTIALLILVLAIMATQLVGYQVLVRLARFLGLKQHPSVFWRILFPLFTLLFMFCFHIALYQVSVQPPTFKRIRIKELWPGALFSTLSIILVTWIFRYYANNVANYTLIYGSIAGLMMLCIWFFLMSAIMLFGGILNMSLDHLRTGRYPLDPMERYPIPFSNYRS